MQPSCRCPYRLGGLGPSCPRWMSRSTARRSRRIAMTPPSVANVRSGEMVAEPRCASKALSNSSVVSWTAAFTYCGAPAARRACSARCIWSSAFIRLPSFACTMSTTPGIPCGDVIHSCVRPTSAPSRSISHLRCPEPVAGLLLRDPTHCEWLRQWTNVHCAESSEPSQIPEHAQVSGQVEGLPKGFLGPTLQGSDVVGGVGQEFQGALQGLLQELDLLVDVAPIILVLESPFVPLVKLLVELGAHPTLR